jgi:hypothetical protein
MGKKIFVSYKYADRLVRPLPLCNPTTVRHYVDELQKRLDVSDHIYKGEDDGEDLSSLADATIGSRLGDKIFDSTVTIVLISKGMKESYKRDQDQWIPWEISYSLREQSREYGNSKTNALLAVVIPDESDSYSYFMNYNMGCNSMVFNLDVLFEIMRANMFNQKTPTKSTCNGTTLFHGECSYMKTIKWDDFIGNINQCVEAVLNIWRNRNDYDIRKSV